MRALTEVLRERGYPGRGCLAARTGDGRLQFGYFLTGRSAASRSRELIVLDAAGDPGDLQVRDTSAGPHDALRHYVAAARRGPWCVVGNGDQVVPLAEDLAAGTAALDAWRRHTFEPDPPIFTSRIWLAHSTAGDVDCLVGHARRSDRGDGGTDLALASIQTLAPGTGVLLTTYDGSVTEVRAATAVVDVAVAAESGDELLAELWAVLDPGLRVAAVILRPDDVNTVNLMRSQSPEQRCQNRASGA